MSLACRELEVALSLRAAGGLDAADRARLEAHLADCPACRAEAVRDEALLDLARLPPPTPLEHRALADLPARVAADLRPEAATLRAPASLRAGRRLAAGLLVAVGIAALALAPIMIHRQRPPAAAPAGTHGTAAAGAPTAAADAGWQEPDLDTLWQDAAVVSAAWDEGSE